MSEVRIPFSKMGQLNLKNTKIKEQNNAMLSFVEDPVHDCWDPFQDFAFVLTSVTTKQRNYVLVSSSLVVTKH